MTDLNLRNLSDFEGDRGRVLLLGPSGSGKTTLAASAAELGKVLYVYTLAEEGISSIKGSKHADNIDVLRLTDPTQIRDVFHLLLTEDHGYDVLVLDSVTGLHWMWMRFVLGLPQNDIRKAEDIDLFLDQQDWGRIKEITLDVMTALYGLASADNPSPVHVIMTSQVVEYEDEEDKELKVGSAVSRGCRVAVHSCPDYILHLELAEDDDALDGSMVHRVRLLPHDRRVTKLHTAPDLAAKLPPTVGNANQMLTIPKFFKMVDVPV